MINFKINDLNDFMNKIAKWNFSEQKYPVDFPKESLQSMKKSYNSMQEYREIMEPLFYLECYEQFRKFCISIKEKRLDIRENAVEVNISNFEIDDTFDDIVDDTNSDIDNDTNSDIDNDTNSDTDNDSNNGDEQLQKCIFEILMPNYFVCGYQGLDFKNKKRSDAIDSNERRAAGYIKKDDLIYLAKVTKDLKTVLYKTIVMSDIAYDSQKNMISIPSRKDLLNYSPVVCTKLMTKAEISELKKEMRKNNSNSIWICIHAVSFGTEKKIFKSLNAISNSPNFEICKEITTGKCRNEIKEDDDNSEEIINLMKEEDALNDHWIYLVSKIYKNSHLNVTERAELIHLFLPNDETLKEDSQNLEKEILILITNLQRDIILPFTENEKKILYRKIFELHSPSNMSSKLANLLMNRSDRTGKLNKTIDEIIQQYHLNITQATILAKVKKNEKVLSLIQGPPGTGKTKMITSFIYQELRDAKLKRNVPNRNKYSNNNAIRNKILVCAPSNTACNEIARRLKRENVNTVIKAVRFAPEEYVDNTISHITLDKLAAKKLYLNIVKAKKFFDIASNYSIPPETIQKLKNHSDNIQSKTFELTRQRKILIAMMNNNDKNFNAKNVKIIDKLYEDVCLLENQLDNYIQIFIDNLLLIDDPDFIEFKEYIIEASREFRKQSLEEANVIVVTLTSSGNELIRSIHEQFSLLIIDESSQATELITLIPFSYNIPKAVLIGDSKQLPPTVINHDLEDRGYNCSFFQRLDTNSPNSVHLLNIQYRMHPSISKLSSHCFYSDAIIDGENVQSKKWEKAWYKENPDFGPLVFYHIKGPTNNHNNSLNNIKEANQIINFISRLLENPGCIGYNNKISIISPYRGQVYLIKEKLKQYYRNYFNSFKITNIEIKEFQKLNLLNKESILSPFIKDDDVTDKENDDDNNKKSKKLRDTLKKFNILENINVNTVDSYQGQESDIVILSCVRSSTHSLGFLKDKRRLNVSITRARYTLIIFGDADTLCKDKDWRNIIKEIKKMNCYKTVKYLLF